MVRERDWWKHSSNKADPKTANELYNAATEFIAAKYRAIKHTVNSSLPKLYIKCLRTTSDLLHHYCQANSSQSQEHAKNAYTKSC